MYEIHNNFINKDALCYRHFKSQLIVIVYSSFKPKRT